MSQNTAFFRFMLRQSWMDARGHLTYIGKTILFLLACFLGTLLYYSTGGAQENREVLLFLVPLAMLLPFLVFLLLHYLLRYWGLPRQWGYLLPLLLVFAALLFWDFLETPQGVDWWERLKNTNRNLGDILPFYISALFFVGLGTYLELRFVPAEEQPPQTGVDILDDFDTKER